MVRFWKDTKDIKLAILEAMPEFGRHDDVVGWIPADEAVDAAGLAEEIARLAKENSTLQEQLKNAAPSRPTFSGLTFEELYDLLAKADLKAVGLDTSTCPNVSMEKLRAIDDAAKSFGHESPTLLDAFAVLPGAGLLSAGGI
jgi:D-ribose pyranose/furanose isomerase RbsD